VGFDLVAQDETGSGVAGAGRVEELAEAGEGLGAAGGGEQVEADAEDARAGRMSQEVVRASRMRAYASSLARV
jgi:hypothetical protein